MFWKRKRNNPVLELDADPGDKREDYRVYLPAEMPVTAVLDGDRYPVRDLSAGGIACAGPRLAIGDHCQASILIGQPPQRIKAELVVIDIDSESYCHLRFRRISAADKAALHRFVLEVQKRQIRDTRERRIIADDEL